MYNPWIMELINWSTNVLGAQKKIERQVFVSLTHATFWCRYIMLGTLIHSLKLYSRWNRISDFSHFLVFWPLFGLKHLVWGSQFVTWKVTMLKLVFRRKFHWKMPHFWAFYHSKLRRKIIHFFIECVSYFSQIIKYISF